VCERRIQRWKRLGSWEDQRHGPISTPANKLTVDEQASIIAIATSKEYCDLSPNQIVPKLADKGEYVASESSFYRVLRAHNLAAHRGRAKPRSTSKPKAIEALAPRQLFSWDITYLKSCVQGQYFYLYLFLDVFSRKIVGWNIHDSESAEHAATLLTKICRDEDVAEHRVTLHSDNGSPMKGATMLVTMQKLGVMSSFSRPSVSNDNPFSESLFRTLKYRPNYPSKPFATIEDAKRWVAEFTFWYNTMHLHSAISFTTPSSRHNGDDVAILAKRHGVYKAAQCMQPKRWARKTRKWEKIPSVKLNWLKEKVA
jgi:transposase InsO family protein